MGRATPAMLAFNRGEVSDLGLARVDLKRMELAAETQVNWMPRTLGSMMLRPGLEYITGTRNNSYSRFLPFVYAINDTALIELSSEGYMRVLLDGTVITRESVSTAFPNGTFTSNITGWTDNSETGGVIAWQTGGYLKITGTGYNSGIADEEVTVAAGDQNTEHAIRITVERGPVIMRVGSTQGDDDYITETYLATGVHSLAFTPTGNFHVRFQNIEKYAVLIDSIEVESSGTMEIATPWTTQTLVDSVRYEQSADVIFIASSGLQQRKIERRGTKSWSLVVYEADDGPFRTINLTGTTIATNGLSGDVTLTASRALFRSSHVGALFKVQSAGQEVSDTLSGAGQATDSIRATGVQAANDFDLDISGTWSGTITLQYSINEEGSWVDEATYTTNGSRHRTPGDNFDNVVAYWRLTFKPGDYTSGSATCTLTYSGGGKQGIARITAVSSGTSASARVVEAFGGTGESSNWYEGAWSDFRGWPTSVAIYESRMFWAGRANIWGSVSDAYASYDEDYEGDARPVSRTLGAGPVDTINWLLPMQRLMIGAESAEISAKSNSFDEPLTQDNINLKSVSTQGSAAVGAVKVDDIGLFVQRNGTRLYELAYDININNYGAVERTAIKPEIGGDGILKIGVQRQPDTRVHCVRSDGVVAVLIYDKTEDIRAWVRVQTDGEVEDVVVLPGDAEDEVYYVVKRTINSSTVRYLERWAIEDDCQGGDLNKQADSFKIYDGSSTTTITGLSHLEGESVVVWADGVDVGTATVSSGQIALDTAASKVIVGLPYTAQYKTRKFVEASTPGVSPFNQFKRIGAIGLILKNTHYQGITFGRDFDNLTNLSTVVDGAAVSADTVHASLEQPMAMFNGKSLTDARVCLQAAAPRPCTVIALSFTGEEHDKS